MANRPDQFLQIASRLDNMLNGQNSLLKIDLSNAFNSIPYATIEKSMEAIALHEGTIKYIMTMLKARKADIDVDIQTGVPQGDPLSMLLFIIAINPFLKELERKYGSDNILGYADDILLKRNGGNFSFEDIKDIAKIADKYGLTVNKDKCEIRDTTNIQPLKFVGIPMTINGRTERVKEITDKYSAELKKLDEIDIPLQQKLNLFRICVNHEQLFHMFVEKSAIN